MITSAKNLIRFAQVVTLCIFTFPGKSFAQSNLTLNVIPIENLAEQFAKDIKRIEVYYPKQFERLEMNWDENVAAYLKEYRAAKTDEAKIHIFSRFYNSWHNGHHRVLSVKGILKKEAKSEYALPIRVFGQGQKFSEAKFFIDEISKIFKDDSLHVGDEIVSYHGFTIPEYVRLMRDEHRNESPENILGRIGQNMALQKECLWETRYCWNEGDKVAIKVKHTDTGKITELELQWKRSHDISFSEPARAPTFPESLKGWKYETLVGTYGLAWSDIPETEFGFLGVLSHESNKYLVIRVFKFKGLKLVQAAITEANKPGYSGVILDLAENGGGDDSAMTLLAGLLGPSFHLELSSIRLLPEFLDSNVFSEATFGKTKANLFAPLLVQKNFNQMSPFTPFSCATDECLPVTDFKNVMDNYDRPDVLPEKPAHAIALVMGRSTGSKSDSIAALFRADQIGPMVGTPPVASSGTYYFKKDYAVKVHGKAIVLGATFTPDFSVGNDCQEIQANPPVPTAPVPRTIENNKFYDSLTWVTAADEIEKWKLTPKFDQACTVAKAEAVLRQFHLKQITSSSK